MECHTYDSAGSDHYVNPSMPTISLNVWTHFAIVLSGTNGYVYVNGVQGASSAGLYQPVGVTRITNNLGMYGSSSYYLDESSDSIIEFSHQVK
jgi:hypothetical protein